MNNTQADKETRTTNEWARQINRAFAQMPYSGGSVRLIPVPWEDREEQGQIDPETIFEAVLANIERLSETLRYEAREHAEAKAKLDATRDALRALKLFAEMIKEA